MLELKKKKKKERLISTDYRLKTFIDCEGECVQQRLWSYKTWSASGNLSSALPLWQAAWFLFVLLLVTTQHVTAPTQCCIMSSLESSARAIVLFVVLCQSRPVAMGPLTMRIQTGFSWEESVGFVHTWEKNDTNKEREKYNFVLNGN